MEEIRTRTLFFGTPEFAVPALHALSKTTYIDLVGVITRPDRAAGRGRRVVAPPIRSQADSLGIPVFQTPTLRAPAVRHWIESRQADLFVVAAFGLILGRSMLGLPAFGAINVHASLLPLYRGASPVAAAIACGERTTGISIMRMDTGLDTGPVYSQQSVPIAGEDTAGSLTTILSTVGAALLVDTLPFILSGSLQPFAQTGKATLTRPLTKTDGWLDWQEDAATLSAHVRAMQPWPRAFTTLSSGARLQVHEAHPTVATLDNSQRPGEALVEGRRLVIRCGDGYLEILVAQPEGSSRLSAAELVQGRTIRSGERLGIESLPHPREPLVELVKGG